MMLFDEGPDRDRWAAHDADFTPLPVIRQGLSCVLRLVQYFSEESYKPVAACDPAAGAGAFGVVFRELLAPFCQTTGIEVREEERAHVERNYDIAVIGSFESAVHDVALDLVATNPPWGTRWPQIARAVIPRARVVALLGPTTWGHSDEPAEALDLFEQHPPWCCLRVPGRVQFRTGTNPRTGTKYSADNRKVAWWVWIDDAIPLVRNVGYVVPDMPAFATITLPRLPKEDRRWTVRPGTEQGNEA